MPAGGRLITIEGIDGSGKSSQTARLGEGLKGRGYPAISTFEPGGGSEGNRIRRLLADDAAGQWSPECETLLFVADRRNHIDTVIEPAMSQGKIVVCDRYADSTRIYQGFGNPELRSSVDRLHELMIGLEPDLTFILDIPIDIAAERIRQRDGSDRRFDNFGDEIRKLRDDFLRLADEFAHRCRIIDGTQSPDAIAELLLELSIEALPEGPNAAVRGMSPGGPS